MSRIGIGLLLTCALQITAVAFAAAPVVVSQLHRAFSVRELHIKADDIVRFSNVDEFLHHVYIKSSTFNFDSGEQSPGHDVDVRFATSGRFEVRCEIHPRMKLDVTVE